MHKPFQKFGFFVSKNVDEETNAKNDKSVKYLYRKDIKIKEKSPKQKIRSANNTDDYAHKYRTHKRRSGESSSRSKRRNSGNVNCASETEIYFISPEEIKRHKRHLQKTREKSSEKSTDNRKKYDEHRNVTSNHKHSDKRKTVKGDEDVVQLIKQYRQKTGIESDDYQWLTKKDIFKLLSNIKNVPKATGSTSFLKRIFAFDKEGLTHEKKSGNRQNERHESQRVHRYSENNDKMIFMPFKSSLDNINKKLEKMTNTHEKNKQEREQKRHREKTKMKENHAVRNHSSDSYNKETVFRSTKKEKSRAIKEDALVFDELELSRNKETDSTKTSRRKDKENGRHSVHRDGIKEDSETRKSKKRPEIYDISRGEPLGKFKNASRANPLRHKYCLVKNTFSIISIPPQYNSFLENKKKLKAFKKYYKYNRNDKDSEITTSNAYHTFSDSHKMYQDISDQSFAGTSEKLLNNVRKKHSLQLETHISAVVISPKLSGVCNKVSSQCSRVSEKRGRVKRQRSKIPVLNSTARIVELVDDSLPTSKSRQISAELFTPKTLNDKTKIGHKTKLKPDDAAKTGEKSPSKFSSKNASLESLKGTTEIMQVHADKTEEALRRVTDKSTSHLTSRYTSVEERPKAKSTKSTPRSNKSDEAKQIDISKKDKSLNFSSRTASEETRSSKRHADKSESPSVKVQRKKLKNQSRSSFSPRSTSPERTNPHDTIPVKNQDLKVKNKSEIPPKSLEGSHSKLISRRPSEKAASSKVKEKKTRQTTELKNSQKELKTSRASTLPRGSKIHDDGKTSSKNSLENKSKNSSVSPLVRSRNESLESGPNSKKSHLVTDGASSISSKRSRRTNKSGVPSKSDTKLQQSSKANVKKRYPTKKSTTKASVSNSTFGDKSMVSSKNETSFLLTKSYRDDEKLNRWQKRKIYSDTLRKNLINKSHKTANIAPQVLEVRYLTVTNDNDEITGTKVVQHSNRSVKHKSTASDLYLHKSEGTVLEVIPSTSKEFYDDDLPPCYMELVEPEKFRNIFELPVDTALNEILSENYNFLKKDFSFTNLNDLYKYSSSEENVSTGELQVSPIEKSDDWYDFRIPSDKSISEIFPCRKKPNINVQTLDLGSQDHIVDSLSAPGSEESGYSTLKSSHMSRSFFERPEIKALFDPPLESSLESYCVEVQIGRSSSSCGLEIKSVESKSLQTSVETSQKSVEIKMSQKDFGGNTTSELNQNDESESQPDEFVEHQEQDGDTIVDRKFSQENKEVSDMEMEFNGNIASTLSTALDKLVEKTKQSCSQWSVHKSMTDENTRKEIKKKPRKHNKKFKCKVSFLSCFKGVSSGE